VSNKIIWIASYPKSGNTYLRCFLSNYLFNKKSNFNFDLLDKIPKFETRNVFKKVLSSKIFDSNFIYYKHFIDVQKKLIDNFSQNELIFKTHHFYGELNNYFFTNEKTTLLFVYLIRDPREIIISYAKHSNLSIDKMLEIFLSENLIRKFKMESIIRWDLHYKSWRSFKKVPSFFIKYEDLVNKPEKIFLILINFLSEHMQIDFDKKLFDKSIELTKFDNLKKMEKLYGFKESVENNFFNTGKVDSWKEILNKSQTHQIESKFFKEMKELGYIN